MFLYLCICICVFVFVFLYLQSCVRGGVEAVEAVELVAGCPLALTPQALGPMISFFPVQV